jgi:hypothetical protein
MPIRHAIWKVGEKPEALAESSLGSEDLLERMILAAPQMLSDEWMFIGQQELTQEEVYSLFLRWFSRGCTVSDSPASKGRGVRGDDTGACPRYQRAVLACLEERPRFAAAPLALAPWRCCVVRRALLSGAVAFSAVSPPASAAMKASSAFRQRHRLRAGASTRLGSGTLHGVPCCYSRDRRRTAKAASLLRFTISGSGPSMG